MKRAFFALLALLGRIASLVPPAHDVSADEVPVTLHFRNCNNRKIKKGNLSYLAKKEEKRVEKD